MKNIELKSSFEEYVLGELVNKLNELDPSDYDSHGEKLDVADLLDVLLGEEQANGCYYIYTADNEQVFKTYFKDILYICDSYDEPVYLSLDASNLLLLAMEHAFESLLQYFESMIEVADLKFDRAGLDTIATTLLDMYPAKIEDLIND